jgi:hypothetical protein
MRGRKMLPNLRRMRAIVIPNPADVKCRAVCLPPTLYRAGTELLEIQLTAETNPPYRTGIAEKYFEFIELMLI